MASAALAINNSGTVVVGGNDSSNFSTPEVNDGYFLYNMNTQSYTSLGSLMLYDPFAVTIDYNGGHEQAINDSGAVVGYIGAQGSTWQAAIWQNGTITNLNTEYASILPAGFVLNNATAIDDNGDIVGYGTDSLNNTYQAFEILNPQVTQLPGDANGDGKVDINDLTIVLAHYNQTGMVWSDGEFTGSGTVDINDLTIVLAHYGQTAGSSASFAAVPEPSAVLLLVAGLAGLLAYVCGKRK